MQGITVLPSCPSSGDWLWCDALVVTRLPSDLRLQHLTTDNLGLSQAGLALDT